MAHPLRVRILNRMNTRPAPWSPRELEDELDEELGLVSYHVKVLKDLELIELAKTAPVRGAVEHFYRAVERAFVPSELAKLIPTGAGRLAGMDILEDLDKDLRASLKLDRFFARDDWHASWTPTHLDDQGCQDAEIAGDSFVERILEIQAEARKRNAERLRSGASEELIPVSAAALIFGSGEGIKTKAAAEERPKQKKNI
jgi:DNA-binding transcriptional ArsR family regulator